MAFPVVQSSNTASSSGASASPAVVTKPTSLAVGDLMVAWAVSGDQSNSGQGPSAPDGTWTPPRPAVNGTNVGCASWWKLATSSDVAASSFSFTSNSSTTAGRLIAGIIRITGHDPVNPINSSNDGSGTTTTTPTSSGISPANLQCLLLMLVCASKGTTGGAASTSGYAIASNNPSWTEQFDVASAGGSAGFTHGELAAASANQIAGVGVATGSASATLDAASTFCDLQIIAIQPPVTFVPTTLAMTSSVSTPGFIRLILPTTLSLTSTLFAPVVSEIANKWKNLAKSVSAWIDTPKS